MNMISWHLAGKAGKAVDKEAEGLSFYHQQMGYLLDEVVYYCSLRCKPAMNNGINPLVMTNIAIENGHY